MKKHEFLNALAKRIGEDPAVVGSVVDATLAQVVTPTVFGSGPGAARSDNNCTNNCGNSCRPKQLTVATST